MARSSPLVRSIRLVQRPTSAAAGVMGLTDRKGESLYELFEIACEIGGRGFSVHRIGEDKLYHVRIAGRAESSCECLGYLAHGRCRHIFALQTLIEGGEL